MAKRRKPLKRPHRKKRWSTAFLSSGKGPNQAVIREYYDRTRSLSTSAEMQKLYDCLFPPHPSASIPPGRQEAENTKQKIISQIDPERSTLLISGKHVSIRLFFNESHTQFYFTRYDKRKNIVQKSNIYSRRSFAMFEFDNNCVQYFDFPDIPKET